MGHQSQQCKLIVILAGNLFLLSNTILCLPSFCAYRFYEIEPRQLFSHKHKHEKFSKVLLQFGNLTKETLLSDSLILYPSRETFTDSLSAILHEIPSLISNMSHPMESVASGWVGGDNKPPLTTLSPRVALSPRATSNQER